MVLRPLEQTRSEWYPASNLAIYFEVSRDVLLDVGMDVRKPDYDSESPYSKKILITHRERICSYDETKTELDCTKGGAGKRDRYIRGPIKDDGEKVVTKSSYCAFAACH